ncbi:hypothetical protein SDJN03_02441, partial [Cucurbita argyrosperma subsp. sororia]
MSIATAEMMPGQAASSHVGADGPFGPVIAILVVMVILGTVAGMIGRLFSGRRVVGGGQYDVEARLTTFHRRGLHGRPQREAMFLWQCQFCRR